MNFPTIFSYIVWLSFTFLHQHSFDMWKPKKKKLFVVYTILFSFLRFRFGACPPACSFVRFIRPFISRQFILLLIFFFFLLNILTNFTNLLWIHLFNLILFVIIACHSKEMTMLRRNIDSHPSIGSLPLRSDWITWLAFYSHFMLCTFE